MEQVKKEKSLSLERVLGIIARHGAIIGICCVLIVFQIIEPRFMKIDNILGVLNSSTLLIVMTFGMTMVMAVRGIDLSIAQVADAAGVVAAMLILSGKSFVVAILGAMLFGLIIGIINAVLISYLGVPAIIGTLGMMFIVRSIELTLTNGAQPQILFTLPAVRVKKFFFIGQGSMGPVSVLIALTILIIIVMYFTKERSVFGRHMDAICGNVKTSLLAGINVRRVFAATFIISSLLAAMAGVMLVSRSGNAVPRGVETYLTDCFVAVYIGTLVSARNKFNIIGSVIGALFVGFISNFITLMGMGIAYKNIFNGVFIILAVALGVLKSKVNS
ncbi:ABC transporter permease [Faecalicatena contorta]|uniref:Ribose transport system permease protein/putative xylitol transport system permease protein n=1 Tax=Faecalicatena contorta TaxID=39482 RepID=A0A316AJN7_9FIRM|nr:ABC transporter permease [Faecalicatena contorta]PWJ50177.1 ribose transport system permease protein/putative xylitol transport system permease protein [Faecalicatena contorta]SUQ14298.1 ribose transport system permease protein/putative xylitol transport system permease protein [Faecalicatena contorta]